MTVGFRFGTELGHCSLPDPDVAFFQINRLHPRNTFQVNRWKKFFLILWWEIKKECSKNVDF